MDHAAVDRFLALNRHLETLAAAGVPLELGSSSTAAPVTLDRFNSSVILRMGRGASLADAISANPQLPIVYRTGVLAALQRDDPAVALHVLSEVAATEDRIGNSGWRWLAGPCIVSALAYLAVIVLCEWVTPTFEAVYDQLQVEPSQALQVLAAVRSWLPYWAVLLPVLVLTIFAIGWRRRSRWWQRIPGTRKCVELSGYARFADHLAGLVEHGVAVGDAVPLAAGASDNPRLNSAATAIAASLKTEPPLDPEADSSAELQALPPMLRWALSSRYDSEPLPTNLRFVAEVYRRSTRYHAERWRRFVPAIVAAVLGGIVVLAYGLAVFMPVVRLLEDLS